MKSVLFMEEILRRLIGSVCYYCKGFIYAWWPSGAGFLPSTVENWALCSHDSSYGWFTSSLQAKWLPLMEDGTVLPGHGENTNQKQWEWERATPRVVLEEYLAILPRKIGLLKRNVVFQPSICRGYVSFREVEPTRNMNMHFRFPSVPIWGSCVF